MTTILFIITFACAAFAAQALAIAQEFQWEKVTSPTDGTIRAFTTQKQYLFATADEGIYRTNDYGNSWVSATDSGTKALPFSCLLTSGEYIFAGTVGKFIVNGSNRGVYRSSDYGGTWELTLKYAYVISLASSNTLLFAGTNGQATYRSSDNGKTWKDGNSPSSGKSYTLCITDSFLLVGTEYGVYRSPDTANNWDKVGLAGETVGALYYLGGSNLLAGVSNNDGVYSSTNYGQTWSSYSLGMTGVMAISVYCFQAVGQYLFAGTDNGMYYSTNNGANWQIINTGLTVPGTEVRALQAQDDYLFAGTNHGIFRAKLPAVGVEEQPEVSGIFISPNPVSESFTVHCPDAVTGITVRDVFGRSIYQAFDITGREVIIPTADYTSGVYFVEVVTINASRNSAKFIIQRCNSSVPYFPL